MTSSISSGNKYEVFLLHGWSACVCVFYYFVYCVNTCLVIFMKFEKIPFITHLYFVRMHAYCKSHIILGRRLSLI